MERRKPGNERRDTGPPPFDYTEWRQTLFEGQDIETISSAAMAARKAKADGETAADENAER